MFGGLCIFVNNNMSLCHYPFSFLYKNGSDFIFWLKFDFKKEFVIVNLHVLAEFIIIYDSINDFIMFIESKFPNFMFNCLKVSVEEEKRKIWLFLTLRKAV